MGPEGHFTNPGTLRSHDTMGKGQAPPGETHWEGTQFPTRVAVNA
jgi:hypothetical protein